MCRPVRRSTRTTSLPVGFSSNAEPFSATYATSPATAIPAEAAWAGRLASGSRVPSQARTALPVARGVAEVDHGARRVEGVDLLVRPERAEVVASRVGHEQARAREGEPELAVEPGGLDPGLVAAGCEGEDASRRLTAGGHRSRLDEQAPVRPLHDRSHGVLPDGNAVDGSAPLREGRAGESLEHRDAAAAGRCDVGHVEPIVGPSEPEGPGEALRDVTRSPAAGHVPDPVRRLLAPRARSDPQAALAVEGEVRREREAAGGDGGRTVARAARVGGGLRVRGRPSASPSRCRRRTRRRPATRANATRGATRRSRDVGGGRHRRG